jgi:RIO kinase 1
MTADWEGLTREQRERLKHKIKVTEKRDKFLIKDRSLERMALEEVFDKSTLMTIYRLLNKGILGELYGAIRAGKESKVYWGRDSSGRELAVKIYLTATSEFRRGMLLYIEGDPRFKRIKRKKWSVIHTWARKEFKNLDTAFKAGVSVPEPIHVEKNVLVMRFIGENGEPAPLLKDVDLENPSESYWEIMAELKELWKKARLVHGDLSEFNIMIWEKKAVLFDISQSVLVDHPLSSELLERDMRNLNRFFKKQGVKTPNIKESIRWIQDG